MQAIDLMLFASEHVHPVFEGFLVGKGIFAILVADFFTCYLFCRALGFFDDLNIIIASHQD